MIYTIISNKICASLTRLWYPFFMFFDTNIYSHLVIEEVPALLPCFLDLSPIVTFLRMFLSGWKTMMYTFGEYKQTNVTVALKLIATQSVVIWVSCAFPVPK